MDKEAQGLKILKVGDRVRVKAIAPEIQQDFFNKLCGGYGIEVGAEGIITRVWGNGNCLVLLDKDKGNPKMLTGFLPKELEVSDGS